jgi:quercetin dioxygenase-like cupin family protein
MINRKANLITFSKNMFGGKGEVINTELLKPDEFCNKGRVFSKIVLKPGDSIGRHTHSGDFEAYYILKGEGKFYDNGEEKRIYAGDCALTKDGESHELINDTEENIEFIALILYSK